MNENRLVPVTPEIKAHPLWDGSMLQLEFQYGTGITRGAVANYVKAARLCSDLTPREKTWVALWEKQLEERK